VAARRSNLPSNTDNTLETGIDMRRFVLMERIVCFLVAMLAALAYADPPSAANPLPPFDEIDRAVQEHFQSLPDYRSTDLITRDQVEKVLTKVVNLGLPLPDRQKILDRVPSRGEFLVDQLATPKGRDFMRAIAEFPDAYDRLDRLSRLPRGKQTVQDLIRGPDGAKMIEYMTTTPGGGAMGRMLSQDPGGTNFNASTGRIYTQVLLVSELKKSYLAAQKKTATKTASGIRP
jgi:hypothetical protein